MNSIFIDCQMGQVHLFKMGEHAVQTAKGLLSSFCHTLSLFFL